MRNRPIGTHAPIAVAQPAQPPSGKSCDSVSGSFSARAWDSERGSDTLFFSPFRKLSVRGEACASSVSSWLIFEREDDMTQT